MTDIYNYLQKIKLTIIQQKMKLLYKTVALFSILTLSLFMSKFSLVELYKGLPDMLDLLKRLLLPTFENIDKILLALLDSIYLAILATSSGLILSLPLVFLSADNISPSKVLARCINFIMSILRTIPSLIYAAILVSIFSVGTFPGLLSLTIIAIVMSHKLLRDAIESLPDKLIISIKSLGANRAQLLQSAILPSVSKNIFSNFFIILESNIRSAAVLGFVGAGGIGQMLWKDLNHLRYDRVSTIILVIFVFIFLLDNISYILRNSRSIQNLNKRIYKIKYFFSHQIKQESSHKNNKFNIEIQKSKSEKTNNEFNKNQSKFNSTKSQKSKVSNVNRSIRQLIYRIYIGKIFISLVVIFILVNRYIAAFNISHDRLIRGLKQSSIIITRLLHPQLTYLPQSISAIIETLFIAISASIIGSLLTLAFSYLAARNTSHTTLLSNIIKLTMNLLRSFPPMITAIIFFRGIGPGPMSAVLSLSLYTLGSLAKLFFETVENIDKSYLQSSLSTGAGNFKIYAFILLPKLKDRFVSLSLYRFESNVRNSTLLGIVGAGGIGQKITMALQIRDYEKASILLLFLIIFVYTVDLSSKHIQKSLR